MGLPHVLVRFYTNPDGRAARRTTLHGAGHAGRLLPAARAARRAVAALRPAAAGHGQTDAAVLLLPTAALPGWSASALAALVAAGRVRGVPVDVVGAAALGGRRPVDRPAARASSATSASPRTSAAWSRSSPPSAPRRLDFSLTVSPGLRARRVDVLPAARARHLVAAASPTAARRSGMLIGGGLAVLGVGSTLAGLAAGRLGRGAARPARARHGAADVPRHGRS